MGKGLNHVALWAFALASISCSGPDGTDPMNVTGSISEVVVPLEIDGTRIHLPKAWGKRGPDGSLWARNNVFAGTGGWGKFERRVGPLGAVGEDGWPPDGIFRANSKGQTVDDRSAFYFLSITFGFPLPPPKRNWWGGVKSEDPHFDTLDVLEISYRAPSEKPMPYRQLLEDLQPGDGDAIGNGWRVVSRVYEKRKLWVRYDDLDWRTRGSPMPRRLAVSYASATEAIWDHHVEYDPSGWVADFKTIGLPLNHWRTKHETAEALFLWIQTTPENRDKNETFNWWADLADRPSR